MPPPPLDYRGGSERPAPPFSWGAYVGGFFLVIPVLLAVGFVTGIVMTLPGGGLEQVAAFMPALAGLGGVVYLIVNRQTRALGLGLLTGLLVVPLVFFVGCAMLLSGANFH